jgi:uncharacterized RDD family membrane protein YckC
MANDGGVYYARADYAGLLRRLAIDAIDGIILLGLWVSTLVILYGFEVEPTTSRQIFALVFFGSSLGYLVLLKRFACTLGYAVMRARVVNFRGETPGLGSLLIRALFVFIGPGNMLLDLIWLTSDPHRQAIRDKFARTYVIRAGSAPAGEGHVRYTRVDMMGFQLLFPEVARNEGAG